MDNEMYMSDSELELLNQFLLGNWYDREEDDDEIVQETVSPSPEYVINLVQILRKFLASPSPTEEHKSLFIRERVDRVLPEGTEGPLRWLASIADQLEQLASQKQS